jgi:hypothetical protein
MSLTTQMIAFAFLTLQLVSIAHAQVGSCDVLPVPEDNPSTAIPSFATDSKATQFTDLRAATPLTVTEFYLVTSCYAAITIPIYVVIYISQVRYTALPAQGVLYGASSINSAKYTFPGLLMTMIKPGDVITSVLLN